MAKKIQTTTYNKFDMYDRKEETEKAYRERERSFNAIRKQEREFVLTELEKRANEKIKYVSINEMAVMPVITIEDLTEIIKSLQENPKKPKKFGLF